MITWLVFASAWGPDAVCCAQSAAARRAAREVVETFGREAVEAAEPRVARLIEAYGDDVARVLRKVGSPGIESVERFGVRGLRILSGWGDDGVRVLASEGEHAVEALARYGDEGVEFMIRHPGVGRDLLETLGAPALKARVSTEGVVALNRMAGAIRESGRATEIMGVVERFGDRACQFMWRNKGVIFGAALLAAFLADPQPYIDGVKQFVVEPAREAALEAVRRTDWTLLGSIAVVSAALLAALAGLRRRRPRVADARA